MENQRPGFEQWIAPLALLLLHGLLFWFALGAVLEGRADFANFYSTAVMVRHGQSNHIYDAEAQRQLQGRLFPQGDSRSGALLFYMHPPFEALLFLPLAFLTYLHAYFLWGFFNLALLLLLPFWLAPCVPELSARYRPYLRLGFVAFFPAFVALLQGQDSILLLLLFSLAYRSLKNGDDFRAGGLLGLGLFRYQISLPFALLFFVQKRWNVVRGFAAAAVLLFLLSIGFFGWSGTLGYLEHLWQLNLGPSNAANMEARGLLPQNMANVRGVVFTAFSPLLPQGALLLITAIASVLLLAGSLFAGRRIGEKVGADLPFCLHMIVTLLISFHLYAHDLALLSLVILVLLDDLTARQWKGKLVRFGWSILAGIFYFSPLYLVLLRERLVSLLFAPLLVLAFSVASAISRRRREGFGQANLL